MGPHGDGRRELGQTAGRLKDGRGGVTRSTALPDYASSRATGRPRFAGHARCCPLMPDVRQAARRDLEGGSPNTVLRSTRNWSERMVSEGARCAGAIVFSSGSERWPGLVTRLAAKGAAVSRSRSARGDPIISRSCSSPSRWCCRWGGGASVSPRPLLAQRRPPERVLERAHQGRTGCPWRGVARRRR